MVHLKKKPKRSVEVLLTDGHTRASLAIARSLARHNISFLVLAEDIPALTYYSRYVDHFIISPSPGEEPEAFIEFTSRVLKEYGIQLAVPVTDQAMAAFDRHRESLSEHAVLAIPGSDAIQNVLDKRRNLELARKLGIPCPGQFELNDPDELPEMIEALGLPIVLKNPGVPSPDGIPLFDFRILYAHSEEELRKHLERYCQSGLYPIFQECAEGVVYNLCCFATRGELRAVHLYHSIRRKEREGVLRRVIESDPEIVEHARAMLGALEWDGVAHIAFFVSRERERMWYMETNGRFWASTEGSIKAGYDFPFWTYEYFLHDRKTEPGPIRIGSQTCWHFGDLMSLIAYLRGGPMPATGTDSGKFAAVLQYISGFNPAIKSDVFRWTDPLPALMEHWKIVENILFPSPRH